MITSCLRYKASRILLLSMVQRTLHLEDVRMCQPVPAVVAGALGSSTCMPDGAALAERLMSPQGATSSASTSVPFRWLDDAKPQRPPQSVKRKAVEALLAARYCTAAGATVVTDALGLDAATSSNKRPCGGAAAPPVLVQSCPASCDSTRTPGWCQFQVSIPHVDWQRVMSVPPATYTAQRLATGYDRLDMGQGLRVLLVENVTHLPDALRQLRMSMQDRLISIDLEWRPEVSKTFTPVAMIQLSSANLCVLVRTCRMHYRLPQPLRDFLADPEVTLLGFSWDTADEAKMSRTFQFGRSNFKNFMDLQLVARNLGYHGYGLSRLTDRVLGTALPKQKSVTMSNWENRALTRQQIKYAALDVLAAGQVFRGLRLWHSAPSQCAACRQSLGAVSSHQTFACPDCDKMSTDHAAHKNHCKSSGHEQRYSVCEGCGRVQKEQPNDGTKVA